MDSDSGVQTSSVAGLVEKGPFVAGGTIVATSLDEALNPTATTRTTGTDSKGRFVLPDVPIGRPYEVAATGYYFDEHDDAVSTETLRLRALHVQSSDTEQSLHVNVITHLTYGRTRALMFGGVSLDAARAQAEQELRVALRLTIPSFVQPIAGPELTIAGTSDSDAYLLAVSLAVINEAHDRAGASSVGAELIGLLDDLAGQLERTGTIDQTSLPFWGGVLGEQRTKSELTALSTRLVAIGSSGTLADFRTIVDIDGDEVADAVDLCPEIWDDQTDTDGDFLGDACDSCPSTACPTGLDTCVPGVSGVFDDFCVDTLADGPCDGGRVEIYWGGFWGISSICALPCHPITSLVCGTGDVCEWEPANGSAFTWACIPEIPALVAMSGVCDPAYGGCPTGSVCVSGACDALCDTSAPSCASGTCTADPRLGGTGGVCLP